MIYKGIIEEIIDTYTVKVRIPDIHRLNTALEHTTSNRLPTASICTVPAVHPNFNLGDIVIVGLENNPTSTPIILGMLYTENINDSAPSITASSLDVLRGATFTQDIKIGAITGVDIDALYGISGNIQHQLDQLSARISELEHKLS